MFPLDELAQDMLDFVRTISEDPNPKEVLVELLHATGVKPRNPHAVAQEILRISASATPDTLFQNRWAWPVLSLLNLYAGPAAKELAVQIYGAGWVQAMPEYHYDSSNIEVTPPSTPE